MAMRDIEIVFHLAADHGGRGYVDLHQAGPASNLFLDGLVFWEVRRAGVEKVVFASSECVYPNFLQSDPDKEVYLTEDLVKPPYDADNMYGWAKLMAELTLKAYYREYGLKAASCRYFTVYGSRGVENHTVIAMVAKAFIGQNPFEVWGDGTQVRNWTYIDDIVRGTLLAAEKIDDGTAVNLGTMERVRVIDAVKMVLEYTGHKAEIVFRPDMPTGPLNRVADNPLARKLLGWEPHVPFREGLKRTIDWYFATKDREQVRRILGQMLT
jgi:nucleoside-diphosphate-sugar epimerase